MRALHGDGARPLSGLAVSCPQADVCRRRLAAPSPRRRDTATDAVAATSGMIPSGAAMYAAIASGTTSSAATSAATSGAIPVVITAAAVGRVAVTGAPVAAVAFAVASVAAMAVAAAAFCAPSVSLVPSAVAGCYTARGLCKYRGRKGVHIWGGFVPSICPPILGGVVRIST